MLRQRVFPVVLFPFTLSWIPIGCNRCFNGFYVKWKKKSKWNRTIPVQPIFMSLWLLFSSQPASVGAHFIFLPTLCKIKNDLPKAIHAAIWHGRFNCVFYSFVISSLSFRLPLKFTCKSRKRKEKRSETQQCKWIIRLRCVLNWNEFHFVLFTSLYLF